MILSKKYTGVLLILSLVSIAIFPQKAGINLGTNVPLNYSAGVSFPLGNKISGSFHAGILTRPYDKLILDLMKAFGTTDALANTIGEAFSIGYSLQPEFHYAFRRFYLGLVYSWYSLEAKETPVDAINNFYSLSLPRFFLLEPVEYNLRSNLHNIGLLAGKKINTSNEYLSFKLEAGFQKTFHSQSILSSKKDVSLTKASELINKELNSNYLKYGYLPSLNVYLTFNL